MRIAVVGCGGIGGVIAGFLVKKGLDVTCVHAKPEAARALNEGGIHIRGELGSLDAPVRAVSSFEQAPGPFDVMVLAVKSDALRAVFSEDRGNLSKDGFLFTIQNGLEILSIAEEFPSVRIVAGAVGFNSIMEEHGKYLVTSRGGITIGALSAATRADLNALKTLIEPAIAVDITENIRGVLWSKLLIVCGVTGLGGASGLLLGELMRRRVARRLFYRIVDEGLAVAKKVGVSLEKVRGTVDPARFGSTGGFPLFFRFILLRLAGLKYRNLKSNIHQSIEKGKKSEVDYINGALARSGERYGVETPANREVVRIVKEIEAGKRKMGLQNLNEIWGQLQQKAHTQGRRDVQGN